MVATERGAGDGVAVVGEEWRTHDVRVADTTVVKRFREAARDEPAREWRALRLLAEYAPGLAPAPVAHDPDGDPPTVLMSRLPGTPMRDGPVAGPRAAALAAALETLHTAVPRAAVLAQPPRIGAPAAMLDEVRTMRAERAYAHPNPDALAALDAWLASGEPDAATTADPDPVFSSGDGNLANFLWDPAPRPAGRVRVVDFENSGRSDRLFELAEITEHASAWIGADLDVPAFLAAFPRTPAEDARLRTFRRLHAAWWLLLFLTRAAANAADAAGTAAHRNPPGTPARQAARLLALLNP